MKYDVYMPCDLLKPFVSSFAVQETPHQDTYKVLPDTSVVIGFQFKGRLSRVQKGVETPLSTAGVSGLADHFRVFKNTPGTGTILVFFRETGAAAFFRQPMHDLFRESISLDSLMLSSEVAYLETTLAEAQTDTQRIFIIERFLISRIKHFEPDKLVEGALTLIQKSNGNIRVKELMQHLHTSQSALEKRFRQTVGATPKKFAAILRLKHAIRLYDPLKSLTHLAYEAGFYDQAHFINDFKTFTGDTPLAFFSHKK